MAVQARPECAVCLLEHAGAAECGNMYLCEQRSPLVPRRRPTPSLPFLFAGKAIDCESVGCYRLGGSGSGGAGTTGLMLSTEFDTPH